jgi:hypothetical protein
MALPIGIKGFTAAAGSSATIRISQAGCPATVVVSAQLDRKPPLTVAYCFKRDLQPGATVGSGIHVRNLRMTCSSFSTVG